MSFFMKDLLLAVTTCYSPVPRDRVCQVSLVLLAILQLEKHTSVTARNWTSEHSLYLLDLPLRLEATRRPQCLWTTQWCWQDHLPFTNHRLQFEMIRNIVFTALMNMISLFLISPSEDFDTNCFFCCFFFFRILPQLKLWILISAINFVLSSHWRFPASTLARAPRRRRMCSHGNQTVSALLACQVKPTSVGEEPAGDLTDLTSLQQWESQGGGKKGKQAVLKLFRGADFVRSAFYLALPHQPFNGFSVSNMFADSTWQDRSWNTNEGKRWGGEYKRVSWLKGSESSQSNQTAREWQGGDADGSFPFWLIIDSRKTLIF